jgi:prepilin signal peptidase PulO-like enzyme (type II secretory pathway)
MPAVDSLPAALGPLMLFVLGLAFGSFGNVLVWRLPRGQSVLGRSRCPQCQSTLGVPDLVPLLSFALLRGCCRHCRAAIATRYPLLELGGGLLFLLAGALSPTLLTSLVLGLAQVILLVIAIIDAETQTIPDALSGAVILLALLEQMLQGQLTLHGALFATAFFGSQWLVSRGRWLGSGDIVLGIGLGLLLGSAHAMFIGCLLAYISGAAVAVVGLLTGTLKRHDHIPFGPFLVLGAVLALIVSPTVVPWLLARGW